MTRRERLERKLKKWEEWAKGRAAKSTWAFDVAYNVPLPPGGEPIHIGHHSEKRHRAALAKVDQNMRKGFEHKDMASHHRSKVAGIESQLDNSVFSDDPDAIEQLQAKMGEAQAKQDRWKAGNRIIRAKPRNETTPEKLGKLIALGIHRIEAEGMFEPDFCGRIGYPQYQLSNNNANIRRMGERIKDIRRRHELAERAEASGGVVVLGTSTEIGAWCQVVFAEKPEREIINELKAAGFHWGSGRWSGPRAKLPESVRQIGGAA